MALFAVTTPVSWVTVTLNGPVAAVFEAASFNVSMGLGCFLVTLPRVTETTVTCGLDTVTVAVESNPVPEILVVSFFPTVIETLENPEMVGPVTVTDSVTVTVVPLVLATVVVTV